MIPFEEIGRMSYYMRKINKGEKGFTLIELVIVVAIIGILMAIAIPNYMRARQVAAIAATKANLRNLATALELYALENNLNTYPPETTGTTKGINDALKDYFPGSSPKNPKNMNYKYIYEGKGASFTIYDPTNYATISGTYLFYAVGPGGSIKELIVNTTIGQEISF